MRRILVDNARRKRAEKRGGGLERQAVGEIEIAAPAPSEDLPALDEALAKPAIRIESRLPSDPLGSREPAGGTRTHP